MAPIEAPTSAGVPGPGYSISHQKVELEIDLASRSLKGKTEITLSPFSKDLRSVRLNCRQCELTKLLINGRPSSGVAYGNPYTKATLPYSAGVQQWPQLQRRIGEAVEKDLTIMPGKNFKIVEVDLLSEEAQSALLSRPISSVKREGGDASGADLTQGSRTAVEQTARFTPFTILIEYQISKIREGIQFAGWEEGDLRYPQAYTTNSLSPGIACCLFPCLDELTSRCTWEISIKCSRTIGDAFKNPHVCDVLSNGVNGVHHRMKAEQWRSNFNDGDKALELKVICTGDMTDEIVDPRDPTKKTVSFISATPVSAQHVGFAIGPFEHVDLAKFRESDEDDRLGQMAVPVHGFCLPGRSTELENTCFPMAKAIDFFTMTYGSFPFSDYKLCFVDDVYPEILHAGCLSICSNQLLFPEDVIEHLDKVTRQVVHALATQWMGINIVPRNPVDTWVSVGIAYYMTDTFIKKLSGNNQYRYNQKLASDRVVELDVDRPTLLDLGAAITIDPSELEFMALKAPLVLFILDQRLKKSGFSGMSRIISRIFLNAKVGDLLDSAVTHEYFVKTCERLGHGSLERFFAQWVECAGCPKFRVTQKFNKKKLVVEMTIRQVQGENLPDRDLEGETLIRELKEEDPAKAIYAGAVPAVFTGPMTIRIHEADGTPYEHIIEIKEGVTRFDVPYNTKYKRLKRTRRQKERTLANAGAEYAAEGSDDVLLYSLGDVLQSEDEIREWKIQEWSAEDEDKMSQESYEWIRMDADFEWICKMSLTMAGYMWTSQLQQDRDVVAQLETIQFMNTQKGHPLISSILIRTLMDHRYFHGIRTAAAEVLVNSAREAEPSWAPGTSYIGQFHLEKAFHELFCYADSPMTRPNNFLERTSYYIRCAIPRALSKVRDGSGRSPFGVRTFLLEKLKFNDNSNNPISDSHYLALLMRSLASAIAANPLPTTIADDVLVDNPDSPQFHAACLEEIDRYRRIDEWIPSYQNILSRTALECTALLVQKSILPLNASQYLQYTADGHSPLLRLNAFSNLLFLGTFKTHAILRLFLFALSTDPSPYLRTHLMLLLNRTLGALAIGDYALPKPPHSVEESSGLIIEQDSSTIDRAAAIARRQTIAGAKAALIDELGSHETFKTALWAAINSPTISLAMQAELLDLCSWLFEPRESMVVVLRYPRYYTCRIIDRGKLLFTPTGVRTTKLPAYNPSASLLKGAENGPGPSSVILHPPMKREGSSIGGPGRPTLKPPKPKRPKLNPTVSAPAVENFAQGGGAPVTTPGTPGDIGPDGKPKIKLKLSLKRGGGAGSPTG